jgi:hypothetical protein
MPSVVDISRQLLWLLCSCCVLLGCANSAVQPTNWQSLVLKSVTLELVDDERFELLRLQPEGYVLVTVGVKNGPMVAPLWYWRLDEDQLIISMEPQGPVYVVLSNPRVDGGRLVVKRNSFETVQYNVRRGDV